MLSDKPIIIKGDSYKDNRGELRFVNDFQFDDVKRFYMIKHIDTSVVRAWQGHRLEKKYFFPVSGSFVVAWVKIDNFENPAKDLKPEVHVLSAETSEILMVPKGYANGLKAMEPHSEIMVLSDTSLEESVNERDRYPADWWLDWNSIEHKSAGCRTRDTD